jgi:ubiquitin-like protein Pup
VGQGPVSLDAAVDPVTLTTDSLGPVAGGVGLISTGVSPAAIVAPARYRRITPFEGVLMATRDTGGQAQTGRSRTEEDEAPAPEASPEAAERREKLGDDVDSMLDEIDSVLEENAEEFVRGYVQKGGE